MSRPDLADLLARARAWAAQDPDDQTRTELEAVLADAEKDPSGDAVADLADRFAVAWSSARPACAGRSAPGRTE